MDLFIEHKQQILERIRANDPMLTSVFLEDTSARDAEAFITAMQGPPANTHVTSVNIRGLPRAKTLDETLSRGAPMDDETAVKLAQLLGSNHAITEFCMDENQMGTKGIAAFLKALRANPNIVSFSPVSEMANPQEQNTLRRLLINPHTGDPTNVPDELLLEWGSKNIINVGKLAAKMPDLKRKCTLNEAVARNLIVTLINQDKLDRGEDGLGPDASRVSLQRPLGFSATVKTVATNNRQFKDKCRQAGISVLQDPENWLSNQVPGEQNIEGLALEVQSRMPSIIYVAEEKLHISRAEIAKMLVELQGRAANVGVKLMIPDALLAAVELEKAGIDAGKMSRALRHKAGRGDVPDRH